MNEQTATAIEAIARSRWRAALWVWFNRSQLTQLVHEWRLASEDRKQSEAARFKLSFEVAKLNTELDELKLVHGRTVEANKVLKKFVAVTQKLPDIPLK